MMEANNMTATIARDVSKFRATQKDIKGSGFGVLEKNADKNSNGNHKVKVRLFYDFAVQGAIAVSGGTKAFYRVGDTSAFTLPTNVQIKRADYQVVTTFTSATDAAILSIGIPTDDVAGIIAALAISNGSNIWDLTAKQVATIQTGTTANDSEVTTAERSIILTNTHASEPTTAGKIFLDIEYIELN